MNLDFTTHIKKLFRAILAPPHCSSCKIMLQDDIPLCTDCTSQIRQLIPTELPLTATKSMTVYALGAYEEPLASLVRAKQYRALYAAQHLGVLLAEHISEWNIPIDYIIPVPLHWRRYAWRGYNQAQIMAQAVAQTKNVPVVQAVKRTKHTSYQLYHAASERTQNVQDAFSLVEAHGAACAGKHLLIIDDLLTTGATLTAVGRALLPLKPASITVLVACKVV